MKQRKKFFAVMLAVAMVITMAPATFCEGIGSVCTVYAASDNVAATGQCGDNLTYTVTGDKESGYAISITGTGDMYDYGLDEWASPWCDYNFTSITIGNEVTSIGAYAFVTNGNKVKLTIGKKVKNIKESAFSMTGIKGTLTIPASVQTIGEAAFHGTSITKLVLGKGVETLGDYAFCECTALKTVDASKSSKLKTIGNFCFESDEKLKTVKINANKLTKVGNESFKLNSDGAKIKVTIIAKTKSKYKKAVKLIKGGEAYGYNKYKFTYKKG